MADTKPKLTNLVNIRFKENGTVVFYMATGESRMGVRANSATKAMREAIELAYAGAVALEVEL